MTTTASATRSAPVTAIHRLEVPRGGQVDVTVRERDRAALPRRRRVTTGRRTGGLSLGGRRQRASILKRLHATDVAPADG
jgi:hypothetical protein